MFPFGLVCMICFGCCCCCCRRIALISTVLVPAGLEAVYFCCFLLIRFVDVHVLSLCVGFCTVLCLWGFFLRVRVHGCLYKVLSVWTARVGGISELF